MHSETLDILRCPYCGGRLELVESLFHRRDGPDMIDAILGCHCCIYPVVGGIPVLHLDPAAVAAREQIESGRPDLAVRTMLALRDDSRAARFEQAAASPSSTYRDLVDALGPDFEGGYFLYRFSDPTYVVADATCRAVGAGLVAGKDRIIDVCGGSGHLTRSLLDLSATPVLADLYFAKLWLARRFTAPGCEPVCCDANAPLPFAAGVFRLVVCSDAFHYIWTKRLLASELMRLAGPGGAVVVTHAHNARQWNPSAGMPLPSEAYEELFAELSPRLFAEKLLLDQIVAGGTLDFSAAHPRDALDADLALTIVATRRDEVFRLHEPASPRAVRGELRINPLYAVETDADRLLLRLRFPSEEYEQEYGAARLYLADDVVVERGSVETPATGPLPPKLADLARRRILLDLPPRYY